MGKLRNNRPCNVYIEKMGGERCGQISLDKRSRVRFRFAIDLGLIRAHVCNERSTHRKDSTLFRALNLPTRLTHVAAAAAALLRSFEWNYF